VVRTALTVGVILLGLLAVTGVELLKGSTLARGETGTSVGRVVDPRPLSADTTQSTETAASTETTQTSTTEPTDEATEPTATDESNSDAERGVNATTDAPQSGDLTGAHAGAASGTGSCGRPRSGAPRRRRPPTAGTVSAAGPARRPGRAQRRRPRLRR
jgi:cytoskeletal protein RodZ